MTASKSVLFNKIIAFFDDYIKHYRAFLQFEYLKMDMINHNQIEKLSDSLSTEQALIMKTNSLENKRTKLLEGFEGKSFAEIAENAPEPYGEKLSKFEDELTLEESQALENSIPVSKALSRYKLVADSKCYEFGVY